ncbi:MAG: MtnX-like HAD-IB family phosphatase [Fusobacteriales bacterium]|nr:MtnX-like HAD-IB family phosphatase [Fusobacteriales bacterium]
MTSIFLVDFDKTISFNDSTDVIMRKHNPEFLKKVRERYRNKQVGIMEFMKSCLESLELSEEEYVKSLEDVRIDRTFKKFLESGLDFRIVSAGTKTNVTASLLKEDIFVDEDLIISNELKFKDGKIKMEFPYVDEERYFGLDKKSLVLDYKNNGKKVIFVGDGPSDYEAVKAADCVFARTSSRLVDHCNENDIEFREFTDFEDLIRQYKEEHCGIK